MFRFLPLSSHSGYVPSVSGCVTHNCKLILPLSSLSSVVSFPPAFSPPSLPTDILDLGYVPSVSNSIPAVLQWAANTVNGTVQVGRGFMRVKELTFRV